MPVTRTVADHLLRRLRAWDVDKVFACPGDGVEALLAAADRAGSRPEFVQAGHEETCAFEAVGYAKFTGRIGVCVAASGTGAIRLLNGLYDAKLDHVPIVAVIGQPGRSATGGGASMREVDLLSLFKDVASDFVQMISAPEQLPNALDQAVRVALAERAPTALIIPSDVQYLPYLESARDSKAAPSGPGPGAEWPTTLPGNAAILRAAEVLNAGRRVAILAGDGARGAHDEIQYVADLLGAGVAKSLLGKDVLSDDLPYVTGSIGLLGTRPSYELMAGCDTLLAVGTELPHAEFRPEPGRARTVQIDIDPTNVGAPYLNEVDLIGDAAATLRALIPHLLPKEDRSWREDIEAKVTRWWEVTEAEAMVDADPINPLRLFSELSGRLPDDAIVIADSGPAAALYARQLRFRGRMRGSLSGALASAGSGVPYGVGAKSGCPDRPVIVLVGEGAMRTSGLAELIAVQRGWPQWADPRLIIAVLHDGDHGDHGDHGDPSDGDHSDDLGDDAHREDFGSRVVLEMQADQGALEPAESRVLPEMDFAAFAVGLGLRGITVDKPDQIGPAWEQALAADRPTVLDVHTGPDVPRIPSHTTFEQTGQAARARIRRDGDRSAEAGPPTPSPG